MIYDKDLAPYGTTREYECAKEISERLKNLGEKEISLTKVSILLYLLYKDDKLGDNCFKFDSVFYKNVYGIPCNKNVVLNFEAEKVYKGNIHRYMCWLESQEKLLDDLILNYGTMSPAELYTMMQYDVFVVNAEINQNIIVIKELTRKAPESSFIKRLVLGKNKKKQ
ncbi:MAG: hypothetical protein PUD59_05995 [bacterium]|nr:hypothetical protein [bacterium]